MKITSARAIAPFAVTGVAAMSWHIWQDYAMAVQNDVVNALALDTAYGKYIVASAGPHWVPMPWENTSTPRSQIGALLRSLQERIDEQSVSVRNASPTQFAQMMYAWDARKKLCEAIIESGQPDMAPLANLPACMDHDILPVEWVETFKTRFSHRYFLSYADNIIHVSPRQHSVIRYCNNSPIAANFIALDVLASRDVAAFQSTLLQEPQSPFYQPATETLPTGECRERTLVGYDRVPERFFYVVPEDSEKEAWFFTAWRQFHATWLNDPAAIDALNQELAESVAGSVCLPAQADGGWRYDEQLDPAQCAAPLPLRSAVSLASPGQQLFLANYPGFAGYETALSEAGSINEDALAIIVAELRDFSQLVDAQYQLHRQWHLKTPAYVMGAELEDHNGPFVEGVAARAIPQHTLFGEPLQIPSAGVVYRLNDRAVYSIADLHQAVRDHAVTAGIRELITVDISAPDYPIADGRYHTRFRFNPNAALPFDTDVSTVEMAAYGLLFQSSQLSCVIKQWVADAGHSSVQECAWIDDQRLAYAAQMNFSRYETSLTIGQFAGFFLIPGAAIKGVRMSQSTRMTALTGAALMGAIEGSVLGAYGYTGGPPSLNHQERFEEALSSAKEGFMYGVGFSFLLGHPFSSTIH